jgi:hypothetical protein
MTPKINRSDKLLRLYQSRHSFKTAEVFPLPDSGSTNTDLTKTASHFDERQFLFGIRFTCPINARVSDVYLELS